jgi:RNA polymerase-binding transcription factor
MSSQLAERDASELDQIERGLARFTKDTYGVCEHCQKRIPLARLNALPYTTLCIDCERELEKHPDWLHRQSAGDWKRVFDSEAPMERSRIDVSELEVSVSSYR